MSVDYRELDATLRDVSRVRVGVFGDFAVDAYWELDEDPIEASVETGRPVRAVRRQRYGPGGAGNVVANLLDLGVAAVEVVGLVGDDPFGDWLRKLLGHPRVGSAGLLAGPAGWQTLAYAKPHVDGVEQDRIDFGRHAAVDEGAMRRLRDELRRVAASCDAVVLNQQVSGGVAVPAMIERVNEVVAAAPECRFLVDSRHCAERFRGAALKLNGHEALRLCGRPRADELAVSAAEATGALDELRRRSAGPVFVTLGADGLVYSDGEGTCREPGVPVHGPVDSVGAGDAVAAALAAVLGAGGRPACAARLGNLAAAVTVRKLHTTGTASPNEIRDLLREVAS